MSPSLSRARRARLKDGLHDPKEADTRPEKEATSMLDIHGHVVALTCAVGWDMSTVHPPTQFTGNTPWQSNLSF